jgi:hypothetical protein
MPGCLLPDPSAPPRRWELVEAGPRNLEAAPFDYRNPFPLSGMTAMRALVADGGNGPGAMPERWPLADQLGEPFDYYANANAAIGVPGGPECGLVDIFGTVRCFSGGWGFGLLAPGGIPAAAPALRARTLNPPGTPIIEASARHGSLVWRWTWFAIPAPWLPAADFPAAGNGAYAWLEGKACLAANFLIRVRCEARNDGPEPARAVVQLGYSQASALCAGAFYASPTYAPPFERIVAEPTGAAAGALAVLGTLGGHRLWLASLRREEWRCSPAEARLGHWPAPLAGAPGQAGAEWELSIVLDPGQAKSFSLAAPCFPAPDGCQNAIAAGEAFEDARRQCLELWDGQWRGRASINVPEAKVRDAFRQALNHLDLCGVRLAGSEYPTPGPSGGHHLFYERDAPDMIVAYDLVGEHAQAARMIAHYRMRPPGQESAGMLLWLLGEHYRLTRDTQWLRSVWDMVAQYAGWLVAAWERDRADNGGLLAPMAVGDNELAHGHYVSYHLYAVAGARRAVEMAEALSERETAGRWSAFRDAFEAAVLARLAALAARTGGVITPTFEGLEAEPVTVHLTWLTPPRVERITGAYGERGGIDWHNLAAVFPTGVLPPNHSLMDSSLARWRHAYVEGIYPYPKHANYTELHNYNTLNLSGTWLRRGQAAEAVRDLYGALLHTSATHASGEVVRSDLRWDFQCAPHNWFSGKLARLVRDLLVYEEPGGILHLLAGLSPAWMRPGEVVSVTALPTWYGPISLRAGMRADGLDAEIDFQARPDARELRLHLPEFVAATRAEADGQAVALDGRECRLPLGARRVSLRWRPDPLPQISFNAVADSYLRDYRARREALAPGGNP